MGARAASLPIPPPCVGEGGVAGAACAPPCNQFTTGANGPLGSPTPAGPPACDAASAGPRFKPDQIAFPPAIAALIGNMPLSWEYHGRSPPSVAGPGGGGGVAGAGVAMSGVRAASLPIPPSPAGVVARSVSVGGGVVNLEKLGVDGKKMLIGQTAKRRKGSVN